MKKRYIVALSAITAGTFLMASPVSGMASKATPVGINTGAKYNFRMSLKAKHASHLSKNYHKTMLWSIKSKKYHGRYYRLVRTKKKTLGYIRTSALFKITKPVVKFSNLTINQNDGFDANKGVTWRYYSPDKVHYTYTSHVDTSKPGNYSVVYHFKDSAGYRFSLNRTVKVSGVELTSIYNPNQHTDDRGNPLFDTSATNTSFQLVPRLNTESARNQLSRVTWSSDNNNAASVDKSGKVTTHGIGVARIKATFNSKSIETPVMVVNSSHTGFKSSDDLLTIHISSYDFYGTSKTTLQQKVTGCWITNGSHFISDPINSNENTITSLDSTNVDYSYQTGGGLDDEFSNKDTTLLAQTVDELGKQHVYVGTYNQTE